MPGVSRNKPLPAMTDAISWEEAPSSGTPPMSVTGPENALRQPEDLRTKHLISDGEYQARRKAILDRL